jgi:peptidyl-tRNA hydrolase, PTH1 family
MKVLFAQANPGEKYAQTRHNVGAILLEAYARQHDAVWKDAPKFNARLAETSIDGEKVLLVFPTTYYNETGLSARKLSDFYKLDPAQDLLVIHDDLALPFGTVRTRARGSDAGNNGIKSLNAHIGEHYHRIRVGISIDRNAGMSDVDFVLGRFSADELQTITDTLAPEVRTMLDSFVKGSLELTSHTIRERT